MKKIASILFLFLFILQYPYAVISVGDDFKSAHPSQIFYLIEDSVPLSVHEVIRDSVNFRRFRYRHFSAGMLRQPVWIKFDINALVLSELLLEIEFQDINLVQFYQVSGDSVLSHYSSGDYYPFRQRPFYSRNFVFPFTVQPSSRHTLYLRINAHGEPVVVPLKLWKRQRYYEYLQTENFFFGIYFSIIISYFLLGCLVFYVMLNRVNFFYLLYLISMFFFLLSTKGLAYQYLWPESTFIKNIADPFLIGVMGVTSLLFAGEFLQLKMNNRMLYRMVRLLASFTAILAFTVPVFMSMPEKIMHTCEDIYLFFMICDAFFAFALAIISCTWQITARNLAYFIAYTIVSTGFIIYYLQFYGVIPHTFFTRNIIFINALIEFSIFSTFLTRIVYKRDRERSVIQSELLRQRERVALAVLEGEEAERQRLSRELHDGLGLWLAVLKNRMSGLIDDYKLSATDARFNDLLDDLETACNDVRNISYNLSPYSLERAGLLAAAEDLIIKLNGLKGSTRYTFFSAGDAPVPTGSPARIAYRIIQELIHNAQKYSGAQQVDLSIFSEPDCLTIQVRDNGRGFNPAVESKSGTGLKNIARRLELISGKLNISTEPGSGTTIRAVLYYSR